MIKLIKRLWSFIFKNNKKDMFNENELISYKQNITGESFQWIKTHNSALIGKVVKCRDVQPQGNTIVAIFDDGSSIPVSRLNNDLMMIHGDMQPLTKAEVEAINGPAQTKPMPDPQKAPVAEEIVPSLNGAEPTGPAPSAPISAHPRAEEPKKKENPFKMFNSDETEFTFKLNIKIPDKKLLKMMYNNAENKEEFVAQLSDYVHESLTKDVIESSLKSMLEPKAKVKKETPKAPTVNLIPIEENGEESK